MQTLNSLTKKQDLRNNIYHQNCMPSFLRPHPYYHSISNNILFVAQECWVIQNDHAWLYFNPTGVFALFVNQFDYSAPDHLSTKWAFFSSNNNRLCLLTFCAWSWSSLIIADHRPKAGVCSFETFVGWKDFQWKTSANKQNRRKNVLHKLSFQRECSLGEIFIPKSSKLSWFL